MMDAAALASALGLRRSGRLWQGPCPCCAYDSGFVVQERDGRLLFHCHVGCPQTDVLDALKAQDIWPSRRQYRLPPSALPHRNRPDDRSDYAVRLWNAAKPAAGSVVEAYLHGRSLRLPPNDCLRFQPDLRHAPTESRWPAMIAAVRDSGGRLLAVHRTWLKRDGAGKAPVEPAKMTLGPLAGGAVQLTEAGGCLTVCEGIETGLAIWRATGRPVWSGLSTGGMLALRLPAPPLAAEVIIAADNDLPGLKAAESAAARWHAEGRRVIIAPSDPGLDFNDMLLAAADEGSHDR